MEGIERKKEWRSGELADFFQQMAVMTGSGIPLCRALGILGDCTDSRRFRKIYEELRRKMEKGTLASSAMEQTGVFPEMAVNMIRAGEAGGTVQEMAGRLAVHYRKEHRDAAPGSRERSCIRNFWGSCRYFWFCRFFS